MHEGKTELKGDTENPQLQLISTLFSQQLKQVARKVSKDTQDKQCQTI